MNDYPAQNNNNDARDESAEKRLPFGTIEKGELARRALIELVVLSFADKLSQDIVNKKAHYEYKSDEKLPQYIQLSLTNALSEDRESFVPTLTMCWTNPEPIVSKIRRAAYYEKLYVHIPYSKKTLPTSLDMFDEFRDSNEIYLEYQTPVGKKDAVRTARYKVTPEQITPYKSYESGETQQDEVDLFTANPDELMKLYLSDSAAISWSFHVLEHWQETPLSLLE